METLKDEGGIIAVGKSHSDGCENIAEKIYMGLLSLQHRGQDSAGIAAAQGEGVYCYKEQGLVSEVFNDKILSEINGDMFLAHVKNGGKREWFSLNAQPMVISYRHGSLAVAFNGALVNGPQLRELLENDGVMFTTQSDSEILAAMVARRDKGDTAAVAAEIMPALRGGYAAVIMTSRRIIGMRDPHGIRPLALGRVGNRYVLASESCVFDMMGGHLVRDLMPGEVLSIEGDILQSVCTSMKKTHAGCIFEYIYLASPDSTIDSCNVYLSRERSGYILAQESPVNADIVTGVPDSGTAAALGYARGSGIPYSLGLTMNRYIGRTFIQATQAERERSVRIKLNAIKPVVENKRVVLVDDSIVRGTTMRHLVSALRKAGAAEVHLRISSPPVGHGCKFGINADKYDLAGGNNLGADSLAHISIDGMLASLESPAFDFCIGCFSGKYPDV
ncbi:MAG: amidophosphoribosyltransferase [Defluviitaleaceae bacterium]|nr:amidophosphoribosyltransferase [Defluviitaleaceae bacterium]